jgi:hypothetical protein
MVFGVANGQQEELSIITKTPRRSYLKLTELYVSIQYEVLTI